MTFRTVRRTLSANRAMSVADKSFSVVHIGRDGDGPHAVLATNDPARGPHWSQRGRGMVIRLGEEAEIFPGVRVSLAPDSRRARIRMRIVAPEGMPVTRGYPYERKPRLVISNR